MKTPWNSAPWKTGIGALLAATFLAGAKATGAVDGGESECPTPKGLAQLAARLQSREAALDRREADLAAKEADLRAAEARLAERLADLQKTRAEIAEQLDEIDVEEAQKRDDLVIMLQSVRPKQGAPILSELSEDLAVDVIDRMNPAKAGKLMSALPPATAAALMEKLSRPVEVTP